MKPDSENLSPRSQKLNPAGVAAIPVATSSILPSLPPPPSGARPRRPAHPQSVLERAARRAYEAYDLYYTSLWPHLGTLGLWPDLTAHAREAWEEAVQAAAAVIAHNDCPADEG